MNLTRLIPGPAAEFDLDSVGATAELSELYRPPRARWLRLNLVASINGNAAGADGTSDGLTSRTDRRILGAIRRLSDVVLVGASSVRKEGYFLPMDEVAEDGAARDRHRIRRPERPPDPR